MNRSASSFCSARSDSPASKKSFRVLIKNRITRQIVKPEQQKSKLKNNQNQEFEQTKSNLKKYIRAMKTSSKISNYQSKINTNRSNCPVKEPYVSSRINLESLNKLEDKNTLNIIKQKSQLTPQRTPNSRPTNKYKYFIQNAQQESKLPNLNKNFNSQQEPKAKQSDQLPTNQPQTSESKRLSELQNKIQSLLRKKLKILSSTDSFCSRKSQTFNAFKLFEMEMDRILEQIKLIKQNQPQKQERNSSDPDLKDIQISTSIEILQKKVKIIQRLIAQKLFESDNLKNQYLWKIKQHKKNHSLISNRKSKSSIFHQQSKILNPANFKPKKYEKQTICTNELTTNKADFKTPLKSYYITPHKDNCCNSNKLNQPLPRSTYNREYLIYGTLPKDLLRAKSNLKDYKVPISFISHERQKNFLEMSTYKSDFISKKQKDPTNFKEFDAYKDKLKNVQVNYGKEKNIQKVVNNNSAIDYHYKNHKDVAKENKSQLNLSQQNPQTALEFFEVQDPKKTHLKSKFQFQQPSKPNKNINLTEKREAMIEQDKIQKKNLFSQRIKSEIKHKNIYDQKYKFKNELIKQKDKKCKDFVHKITNPLQPIDY